MLKGREPVAWPDFGIPILVGEVLSPSTARYDRVTKRRRYKASGVGTYWIIDPEARLVEQWLPSSERPDMVDQTLEWRPDATLPPFTVDLAAYFRAVWCD